MLSSTSQGILEFKVSGLYIIDTVLSGLLSDTLYSCAIVIKDDSANTYSSDTVMFITQVAPVGITDDGVKDVKNLFVYPNPMREIMYIHVDPSFNGIGYLLSETGQVVRDIFITGGVGSIKRESLAKGVYLIQVPYGDAVESKKILIR